MTNRPIRKGATALAALALLLGPSLAITAGAFPLDGKDANIRRLALTKTPPQGGQLGEADIRLNLLATRGADYDLTEESKDPALQAAIDSMFRSRDLSYGLVVIDITDPAAISWAALRADRSQIPGSVGKILTMLGYFSELENAFPDEADRARILRTRMVTAGNWTQTGSHTVPKVSADGTTMRSSTLQVGETYSMSEWLDFAIAYSANGAASTVWKETVLLRHFGTAYPPSPEAEAEFFKTTPKSELWKLASDAISAPMLGAGLDPETFWIGSLWTSGGKAMIPGSGGSRGTPMEMAKFILRMEQGRLVDNWSSLEMKKYLYQTSRRYRYTFSPELAPAAVYFKSGSLYKCVAEEGYACGKYMGNAQNAMNSVTLVETPAKPEMVDGVLQEQRRYIVALTSDVRKVNSAWDHSRIGAAIDKAVASRTATALQDTASKAQIRGAEGLE